MLNNCPRCGVAYAEECNCAAMLTKNFTEVICAPYGQGTPSKTLVVKTDEREKFEDWFAGALLSQTSCLLRDVLRDCKNELWESWQKRKPYG